MKLVMTSTLAPWCSAVSTVLCLLFFTELSETPWRGDYFWTVEWIEGSLIPALAVTAIAVAIDIHLTLDPRRRNVVASKDLRAPCVLRYVAAVWLPIVIFAAASTARWALQWPTWWNRQAVLSYGHMGVCLLSILAFLVLVALAALAVNPFGYIAGAAVGLFLVWAMMTGGGLLLLGTSTGSLVGYEPVPWILGIVAGIAVLIIACGLWALIRWPLGDAASSTKTSLVPRVIVGVVVVGIGVSPLLHLPENQPAWYKDTDCVKTEGGALCVTQQQAPLIDSLAWQYGQLREVALQFGVLDVIPVSIFTGMPSTHPGIHVNDGFDVVSGPRAHPWYPAKEELSDRVAHGYSESFLNAVVIPGHCAENQQEALLPHYGEAFTALQRMLDESLPENERRAAAELYRAAAIKLDACES